jgi:K+-transporting ATPase KdpF subunit
MTPMLVGAGVVALALFAYLMAALLFPEKMQ